MRYWQSAQLTRGCLRARYSPTRSSATASRCGCARWRSLRAGSKPTTAVTAKGHARTTTAATPSACSRGSCSTARRSSWPPWRARSNRRARRTHRQSSRPCRPLRSSSYSCSVAAMAAAAAAVRASAQTWPRARRRCAERVWKGREGRVQRGREGQRRRWSARRTGCSVEWWGLRRASVACRPGCPRSSSAGGPCSPSPTSYVSRRCCSQSCANTTGQPLQRRAAGRTPRARTEGASGATRPHPR
mmetsp:Transcript_39582/g.97839  ORF Transcript_39582/g.97839 Transcript_39582/m.97839 type:complete len:245 (+) Transcript_39582:1455-2189(+)